MELLQKLVKAVSYAYKKDGTCPGVLCSILKDGSAYVSIVRYGVGQGFKNGKKVVVKYTDSSGNLEEAIYQVSKLFLDQGIKVPPNPLDILLSSIDDYRKST